MKLEDENIDKVMVNDMPEQEEYSQILYDAQEAGKYVDTDFARSQEASSKAWTGISHLMAKCIGRGMRLAKEGKG